MQTDEQKKTILSIAHKLASLGMTADFIEPVSVGPIVSVYRFQPKGLTKVSHLEGLSADFAVSLGAEDIVVKRMPGESAVGIFVPNAERTDVKWFNLCSIDKAKYKIGLPLGIDYLGRNVVEDLATLPHLLIAGSTGGGKSTLLNSLIASLILNYDPKDLELVLCDIKEGVEFSQFTKAPHLRSLLATTIDLTHIRMDELVSEMERRYKLYANAGVKNISEYNLPRQGSSARLPYICLIIDEFADLLNDKRVVDDPEKGFKDNGEMRSSRAGEIASRKLSKLASKARASGIHLILATQRPSAKLLEGDIKSNFPARLAFRLPSQTDSRVVLDTNGAEHLLTRGDMLFINPNRAGMQRIHAPFCRAEDVKAAIEYSQARR